MFRVKHFRMMLRSSSVFFWCFDVWWPLSLKLSKTANHSTQLPMWRCNQQKIKIDHKWKIQRSKIYKKFPIIKWNLVAGVDRIHIIIIENAIIMNIFILIKCNEEVFPHSKSTSKHCSELKFEQTPYISFGLFVLFFFHTKPSFIWWLEGICQ